MFLVLHWRRDNKLCFTVVLKKKQKKKQKKKNRCRLIDSLSFLSTLRGWIFPWAFSPKFITWAKYGTLKILTKTPSRNTIRQIKSTRKFLHALKGFPNFSFVCFHWRITWHLGKVNKKVKNERMRESAIELTLSPCVWDSHVSTSRLVYLLKGAINHCCRTCTILYVKFKKVLRSVHRSAL